MNVIVCDQVTKYYDQNLAVDKLDLQVKKGEFFAFLGPNGAGKSTTISMLFMSSEKWSTMQLKMGPLSDVRFGITKTSFF